jgi:hypothetical protein
MHWGVSLTSISAEASKTTNISNEVHQKYDNGSQILGSSCIQFYSSVPFSKSPSSASSRVKPRSRMPRISGVILGR